MTTPRATGQDALSKDALDVLSELIYAHDHPKYPEPWLRRCHISGPMRRDQAKAIRELLRAGYIEFRQSEYRPNRNYAREYRATNAGREWLAHHTAPREEA